MKKYYKIIPIGALIILVLLLFINYLYINDYTNSIYVMTQKDESGKIAYYEINDRKNYREVEKFKPAKSKVLTLNNCYNMKKVKEESETSLEELCTLRDSQNDAVYLTQDLRNIVSLIGKKVHHEILVGKVIILDDDYYVVIRTNVNWYSPCDLYKYNKEKKELEIIYNFNKEEVVGIKLK